MLMLSGASEMLIEAARNMDCAVCRRATAPRPPAKAAYCRPLRFNQRLVSDTFYIWDALGHKFAVTHIVDGFSAYHMGEVHETATAKSTAELLERWISTFGPPETILVDEGSEYLKDVGEKSQIYGFVLEPIPPGAKWRAGLAERHGSIAKIMGMRVVQQLAAAGVESMRQVLRAVFSAKNRMLRHAGWSPLQVVTGRDAVIPSSLLEQVSTNKLQHGSNSILSQDEALAYAERIRAAAGQAYLWLDSHQALRRALAARSRPPKLQGLRPGIQIFYYKPPVSRRAFARMQDQISWVGPAVVVALESADGGSPLASTVWFRHRGALKRAPLEYVRLATAEEVQSND
jgi:hypothetical protein